MTKVLVLLSLISGSSFAFAGTPEDSGLKLACRYENLLANISPTKIEPEMLVGSQVPSESGTFLGSHRVSVSLRKSAEADSKQGLTLSIDDYSSNSFTSHKALGDQYVLFSPDRGMLTCIWTL